MDDFTTNIVLGSILGGLIVIFAVKALITRHNIPYFIFAFLFMASGAGFFIFMRFFFSHVPDIVLIPIELMFFGISLFLTYMFLESLCTFTRLKIPFVFAFICLIIQQFCLNMVIFIPRSSSTISVTFFWFVADVSYNILGLITNLLIGMPFYIRNFQRSRKISALILAIAFGLSALGFISLFLADTFWFFSIFPVFQVFVFGMGNLLPIIGFVTIITVYSLDIHHFYQIPSDLFVLMVTDEKDNIIFQSKYEVSPEIQSKVDQSLPNLLESINRVFQDTYLSKTSARIHMNEEVSMIREVGKQYSAVIVSTSGSRMMVSALRRFLKEFESNFSSTDLNHITENADFYHSSAFLNRAVEIVVANFPFLMNKKK
ncbi:MAG: hypothetical protein ACTSVZ_06310 [Promethearchaeota archaeon]